MSILSQIRLLHLISPSLPIGTYSYSQGMETAVELSWVRDEATYCQWASELILGQLAQQELPLLLRLYRACEQHDTHAFEYWSQMVLALRDTSELRHEEQAKGAAFYKVLCAFSNDFAASESDTENQQPHAWSRDVLSQTLKRSQLASLAYAASAHEITHIELLTAFAHAWLDSHITTAVKVIPLGQSAGQRIQYSLASKLVTAVEQALTLPDETIGFASPAISTASCAHETQYSRIYRS